MQVQYKGMNTSNGCEGWHSHVKNNLLQRRATRRVTDLVNLLLESVGQQIHDCAVVKALQHATPNARRERSSKQKAEEMLQKDKNLVVDMGPGEYLVHSATRQSVSYDVESTTRETDEVVEWCCNCYHYRQTFLRCKHIWLVLHAYFCVLLLTLSRLCDLCQVCTEGMSECPLNHKGNFSSRCFLARAVLLTKEAAAVPSATFEVAVSL